MRKINLYSGGLLLFLVLVAGGCEGLFGGDDEPTEYPKLSLSITELVLPAAGGSHMITVTANQSDWIVTVGEGAEWCRIEQTTKGFFVKIDENQGYRRNTLLEISLTKDERTEKQNIIIHQTGYLIPSLALNPDLLVFDMQGGTQNSTVDKAQCWAETITGREWCEVSVTGNTLQVSASANPGPNPREALIIAGSGEILPDGNFPMESYLKVRQNGSIPMLEISRTSVSFGIQGGNADLIVYATESDWKISLQNNEWCTYKKEGHKLTLTVGENKNIQGRKTMLTLTAGNQSREITVAQTGVEPLFEASSTALSFGSSSAEIKTVSMLTNAGSLMAKCDHPEWCSTFVDRSEIYIITKPNWNRESRQTIVTVCTIDEYTGQNSTIEVKQEGTEFFTGTWLYLNEYTLTFKENHDFRFVSTFNGTIPSTYNIEDDMINIDGFLSYRIISVSQNELQLETGEEIISLKRVTSPTLSFAPAEIEIGNLETVKIAVTSNTVWYVSEQPEWVTIVPSGGYGNGEFSIFATISPADAPQKATLSICFGNQKKTLTITPKAVSNTLKQNVCGAKNK